MWRCAKDHVALRGIREVSTSMQHTSQCLYVCMEGGREGGREGEREGGRDGGMEG
jgi:hypothetical protein